MANNSKDERILSALLNCNTIRQAAVLAGVSEQAIYSRLKNDTFISRYNEAKTNIIKQSATYLQGRVSNAIKVIDDIINDYSVNPQSRIYGAKSIIELSIKLTEQSDIMERLSVLENEIKS